MNFMINRRMVCSQLKTNKLEIYERSHLNTDLRLLAIMKFMTNRRMVCSQSLLSYAKSIIQ